MLDATAGLGLGLCALLDDVPDLGHGCHDGRPELGEGALWLSARVGESARVAVADGGADGKLRLLGGERQDMRQGQEGGEHLLPGNNDGLEVLHDTRHLGEHGAVPDHDALGLAGRPRRVHDNRHAARRHSPTCQARKRHHLG